MKFALEFIGCPGSGVSSAFVSDKGNRRCRVKLS